jgi:TolB protein
MKKILAFLFVAISISGNAQHIVFNFYDSSRKDYEIMRINLDGTGQRNITNRNGTDWTYYAYKDVLYFISDRDTCNRCFFLYSVDRKGYGMRKVTDLMLEDSWMSSRKGGTEMIVSGRVSSMRNQLYLVDLTNGKFRRLTSDTSAYFNDPVFVNDGKQIVFRYKKERRNRNMKSELWIMNEDSSDFRQLTKYPEGDTSAPWHAYHAGPPKWNAAKGFISYQSIRYGKYHIYAVTPDGKKQWQLTNTELNEGWHDWSSDGKWIVYDSFNDAQTNFDIMIMNIENGEKRFVTKGGWRLEYGPVFINY